ncbi:MAG TPA: hypothetical protein VLC74_04810 [Rhizomicrobium sp.]|nr:hypothetical protein [Rhizomicrobium sp.]
MGPDFEVFAEPGFWVSVLLLVLCIAIATAIIWMNSTTAPF